MKLFRFLILWLAVQLSVATLSLEAKESAPLMIDKLNGWKMSHADTSVAIMRTSDGGNTWVDVSPHLLAGALENKNASTDGDLEGIAALCPLDAKRAWMAVIVNRRVILEFTSSAGRRWSQVFGPTAMTAVAISFLNEKDGFVLNSSDPAAGRMKKEIYSTKNGGRTWNLLASPNNEGTSYYTTGIAFRSQNIGWVTGTYHGVPDAPLFRTEDGGQTWKLQTLKFPTDYLGGYADIYPPVFVGDGDLKGYLPVKLVRHDPQPGHYAWVNYETDDGGATWHLPASGVQSVPDN